MNDNLTPKQSEVYDYVKAAMREKGYCPTVREICLAVGLTSTSSVHAHLNTLERRGYIRRNPLKPRTIELVESAAIQERDLLRIPIVGTVAAGMPLLADQNIDDYVSTAGAAGLSLCSG